MNKQTLIASALAVLGLTACEKGLDAEGEFTSSTASQVTNSVLQVTTRGGGGSNDATIAYPVQVYVFQGNDCKAVQTIGDEGQTLNLPLVEGRIACMPSVGQAVRIITCRRRIMLLRQRH